MNPYDINPQNEQPVAPESSDADRITSQSIDQARGDLPPAANAQPVPPSRFVPEDLRAPWGWLDLLIFTLLGITVAVLLLIVMTGVFVLLGHRVSELQASPRVAGLFGIFYEILLVLFLFGGLALYVRVRFQLPFWRTLGWRPLEAERFPKPLVYLGYISAGFLLAVFAQVVSTYVKPNVNIPMEKLFQDRLVASLLLLMSVLMAPVVEETFFRGFLYPVIARSFGRGVGIIATGTLFGLLHGAQLGWTPLLVAALTVIGIVLTYVRAVKHTVLASFLLHISYNGFISIAFLIGSHGLRMLPHGS